MRDLFYDIPNDWWTHRHLLYEALIRTLGPVLELGVGAGSTPLLHDFCAYHKRPLDSCENTQEWAEKFIGLADDNHHFYTPPDWEKFTPPRSRYGVALVDHSPNEGRADMVRRLKPIVDVIVMHDTEEAYEHIYHSQDLHPLFKFHVIDRPGQLRWTTAFSDVVDVTGLVEVIRGG